ncbi:hypothetical protein THAOC_02534, partial [Thalassiosira oceanica]
MSKPMAHSDEEKDEGEGLIEQLLKLGHDIGLGVLESGTRLSGEESEESCAKAVNTIFEAVLNDSGLRKLEEHDLSDEVSDMLSLPNEVWPLKTGAWSKQSDEVTQHPPLGEEIYRETVKESSLLRNVVALPEITNRERNSLVTAHKLFALVRAKKMNDALKKNNAKQRKSKKSKKEGPYDKIAVDFVQCGLHDFEAQASDWGSPDDWDECIKQNVGYIGKALDFKTPKKAREWLVKELDASHPVRKVIEEFWRGVGSDD